MHTHPRPRHVPLPPGIDDEEEESFTRLMEDPVLIKAVEKGNNVPWDGTPALDPGDKELLYLMNEPLPIEAALEVPDEEEFDLPWDRDDDDDGFPRNPW